MDPLPSFIYFLKFKILFRYYNSDRIDSNVYFVK